MAAILWTVDSSRSIPGMLHAKTERRGWESARALVAVARPKSAMDLTRNIERGGCNGMVAIKSCSYEWKLYENLEIVVQT